MRIAFVTGHTSRNAAGVSAAIEDLSSALAVRDDISVCVFGLKDSNWSRFDSALWTGAETIISTVVGPSAFGYAPEMLRQLCAWKPDVVHVHGLWMHPMRSALQCARRVRAPLVISPHGMLNRTALNFSRGKKLVSRFLFQDAAFDTAGGYFATSLAEAEDIRSFNLNAPVAIVPHGINLPVLAPRGAECDVAPYVLSLGRITEIKGLDRLVLAWADIEAAFPNWRLKIVGPCEGGYSHKLMRLIGELELKNVSVSGPVFGDAKFELLRQAEVFALPTLNENFAMTVGESLAVGTPVIATKGAPWAGLVDHKCGWWIDHGPAPMAAALREAMSIDRAELLAMGERGRFWIAQDFSWDRNSSEMLAFYDWICGRGEKPSSVLLD